MNRVAVSLLNHKGAQSTIACVQSLLLVEEAVRGTCQFEIFVADNASCTEDRHQLQQFLEGLANIHFQANIENLGFSAGHNRNLQIIFTQSNPDYIWLLNNDCLVAEQALHALLDCARLHPEVGIWGATLLESDGETIQCAGGCFYNSWVSSYRQYGRGKPLAQLDQLQLAVYDYIAGASLFFPVGTLQNGLCPVSMSSTEGRKDQQQWLNESYFLYFEELDLVKRLKPGLKIAWCKEALIKHTGGASTGTKAGMRTNLAEYHSTLSALKFTHLYYPHRLWVMAPARFFAKGVLLLVGGNFRLVGAMMKAYWDFGIGRIDERRASHRS